MRVIKLAILSFIFLFLLVTIISFFIPGHIRISKATNIVADDTVVYTYIKDLSKWKQWHPALKSIPENEFQILDSSISIRGTVISIAEKKEDELVTEMKTDNGRPILSGFKIIRHQQGDSATLQWYMDFKLRWYPWEKFRSLFYENIYGLQMEQGLSNLKELSEGRRSSSN
jgi:Polyketide cyclase / dehydrase and lipid transport